MITITTQRLKDLNACQSGIDEFVALFGNRLDFNWDLTAQLFLLRSPLRKYLGWAWINGLLPMWSMKGLDFAGSDLTGANLTGANLTGANLTDANLAGANLTGAKTERAIGL